MDKSVLVTGGAGYIGSHVVLALLDAGLRPVVLDNLRTGVLEAVPAGVAFHHADVADAQAVRRVLDTEDIGAVMHFAGSIIVPESLERPDEYYSNNTAATLNLVRCCLGRGPLPFIFSSTAAVYGEPTEQPVTERTPTAPLSPYGWSKLMSEQMLMDVACANPDFRPVCLRYFNVAGADPDGRTGQRGRQVTHLIRMALDVALGRRERLDVFGGDYPTRDGTCERDFIHVSDLAAAHVAALRYLLSGGEPDILNCGYGRGASVLEVVATLQLLLGEQVPHAIVGRRPGDAPAVIASAERLRQKLDWSPRFEDLSTILSHALAWERRGQ